jgi:hypothetical protein
MLRVGPTTTALNTRFRENPFSQRKAVAKSNRGQRTLVFNRELDSAVLFLIPGQGCSAVRLTVSAVAVNFDSLFREALDGAPTMFDRLRHRRRPDAETDHALSQIDGRKEQQPSDHLAVRKDLEGKRYFLGRCLQPFKEFGRMRQSLGEH